MKAMMMLNREVKRVPLNFKHPLHEVWNGFQNPFYKSCLSCNGTGYTKARHKLDEVVSQLIYSDIDGIKELTLALADKKQDDLSPFGLGGTDRYHVTTKIIKLAGLPEKWGWCPDCKGECVDPSVKKSYDNWESYEPPEGKGFQCWETTSEGSPISPVFKTFDELCGWLADNPSGITEKFSKKDWFDALKDACPVVDMATKKLEIVGKKGGQG